MFHPILVPLDGSTLAEAVLPQARALAAAFDARVSLLHVLDGTLAGSPDLFDWHLRRAEAEAYLREQAACLQQAGLPVDTSLLEGPAAERIVEYASQEHANLIILSTHGLGGLTSSNVAAIAHKVLERGTASILLVRAAQPEGPPADPMRCRRILVPLDGSRRAECVLPVARMLARQRAELVLAHVTTRPFIFQPLPFTTAERASVDWLVDYNRAGAEKYLRSLAQSFPPPVHVALPVGDNVALTLHQLVTDEAADLVLLSAHGHSAQSQWPYGSLVGNFITHGSVPLLIVQDLPQPVGEQPGFQTPRRQPLNGSFERHNLPVSP
jgi:nucleotide-binding universal stress UspA family protein